MTFGPVCSSPQCKFNIKLLKSVQDSAEGARVTSLDTYKQILSQFQSRGYDELDTARTYCASQQEAFTAAAGWKERGFKIATKLYPNQPGTHLPQILKANIQDSLKSLGTDQVDIWYLHAPDRSVPFDVTLKAVNEAYEAGAFKILGLSNYTSFEVAEIATICKERGYVRPRIYQAMYNAITRAIETELVVACRKYGLDIVIYNPYVSPAAPLPRTIPDILNRLGGGFFSGKYKSTEVPTSGRFSNTNVNQGSAYRDRYFHDHYFKALQLIEPVAEKHNLTLLEIALRWVVHHSALKIKDGNDGIIIGVSSLDQLNSNLTDLEKGPLPQEVVEKLDEAWKITKPYCPKYALPL